MRKVRLFVWGDAVVATGFSRVLHSIVGNLPQDLYDIYWLGVNYRGDPHDYPYKIFPAATRTDPYGMERIEEVLRIARPDVIFLLNDAWIVDVFLQNLTQIYDNGVFPPTIVYFPVDAKAHASEWYKLFDKVYPVTYTKFGREVAETARPDIKFSIIPHGVDYTQFFKMDKQEARQKVFKDHYEKYKDGFIFLNANRNQPRKRLDITVKAFAEFAKGKDDAYLYLHSGAVDSFVNTYEMCKRLEITDKVIYSSRNTGPSQSSVEFLNWVYNACDVGLNSGLGEGWGLCLAENTPVWTRQGVFAIKDVEPGMEVISHTGNYRKVLRKVYTGKKKLMRINLWANRYIIASKDHEFYTDNGWKKVSELNVRDSVQLAKPVLKEEDIIIDLAKDNGLFCDDDRVWSKTRESGDFTTYRRFVNITTELADTVGTYLASGKTVNGTVFIKTRTDEKANAIVTILKTLGVDSRIAYDKRLKCSVVTFKDPVYVKFFRDNFGSKLRDKTVPDYFFDYSLENVARAYVEYRYKFAHRKIFFYSFTDRLSSFLAFQLYNMNVPVTVKLRATGKGPYCEFTRSVKETNIPIKSNKVFEPIVAKDSPIYWTIGSLEETEELESYDLEIEEDHSYVANGFVVHNCNVEHAVTGAPQILPNHSACAELFESCGLLVNPIMDFTLQDIGTEGGLIHPKTMAQAMELIYKDKNLYSKLSEKTFNEFNREELSWPYIANIWHEIFLGAANVNDNIPK